MRLAVYTDVANFSGKNPYRDAARLSLAYFALENGQKQQAFDLFSQLGIDAAKPAVRAEALTRAGILAADLKQKDKADQLFKAAIALNAEGKWKQIAELEQMKLQYEGDKFSQVLDSYAKSTNYPGRRDQTERDAFGGELLSPIGKTAEGARALQSVDSHLLRTRLKHTMRAINDWFPSTP